MTGLRAICLFVAAVALGVVVGAAIAGAIDEAGAEMAGWLEEVGW